MAQEKSGAIIEYDQLVLFHIIRSLYTDKHCSTIRFLINSDCHALFAVPFLAKPKTADSLFVPVVPQNKLIHNQLKKNQTLAEKFEFILYIWRHVA